jgi:hypothetical protein
MRSMRSVSHLVIAGLVVSVVTAPARAADVAPHAAYRPSARIPLALRTLSYHSAAVLASDPCWRSCTAQCAAHFQACLRVVPLDACFAHNNACDLACLRQCRIAGGPFVYGSVW